MSEKQLQAGFKLISEFISNLKEVRDCSNRVGVNDKTLELISEDTIFKLILRNDNQLEMVISEITEPYCEPEIVEHIVLPIKEL